MSNQLNRDSETNEADSAPKHKTALISLTHFSREVYEPSDVRLLAFAN